MMGIRTPTTTCIKACPHEAERGSLTDILDIGPDMKRVAHRTAALKLGTRHHQVGQHHLGGCRAGSLVVVLVGILKDVVLRVGTDYEVVGTRKGGRYRNIS